MVIKLFMKFDTLINVKMRIIVRVSKQDKSLFFSSFSFYEYLEFQEHEKFYNLGA